MIANEVDSLMISGKLDEALKLIDETIQKSENNDGILYVIKASVVLSLVIHIYIYISIIYSILK